MNILGISAFFHESACCVLRDGRLVAAASEERFSRRKHDPALPVRAFRSCLATADLDPGDLDAIGYYEPPTDKLARQIRAGVPARERGEYAWLDPGRPLRSLREGLGLEVPVTICRHHEAHAASAFFFSGFRDAAVLTADGVGAWSTTVYGRYRGTAFERLDTVSFPHSLGLLYSTLTSYLGFRVLDGEYKVMGLASYGEPRHLDEIFQLVAMGPEGQFLLNRRYFDFNGRRMFTPSLPELFGRPPRAPGAPIEPFHQDVARSLQLALEEILLEKLGWLQERCGLERLCLAGGVALNAVANGRIRREGPFSEVFVQPAAGDAGACLGAAALAHVERTGRAPDPGPMTSVAWGPTCGDDAIGRLLAATELRHSDFRGREDALLDHVAEALDAGALVGWFHGAMEMGPRALGQRSILADPRDPQVRERLNRRIKQREDFRPFAPSVLAEQAADHFALVGPAPFMLETTAVTSTASLPAITHVDGSARPQTVDREALPRFAALLDAYDRRTGCPMVVNTSFNRAGEPIVCTPADALRCFIEAGLDLLVLGDFTLRREDVPQTLADALAVWPRVEDVEPIGPGLDPLLYTFV